MNDPNPIDDPGSPRSTAGINSAAMLCELLEIDLIAIPSQENFLYRWGEKGLDSKPIVASWELTVFDVENNPCSIVFDLLPDDSSIIIGLDVGKFSIQNCIAKPPFLSFHRPTDASALTFELYIAANDSDSQSPRLRIQIITPVEKYVKALTSITPLNSSKRNPNVFAKRIHRLTHASADQVKIVYNQAGILNSALSKAI